MNQQAEAGATAKGTPNIIYPKGTIISYTTTLAQTQPRHLYILQHQEKGKLYGASRSLSGDQLIGYLLNKTLKRNKRQRTVQYLPLKEMYNIKVIKSDVPQEDIN